MRSEVTVHNPQIRAEGRVTIEYIDGITGEVKNKIQSVNHAFPSGFLRNNNYALGHPSDGLDYPFDIVLSDRGDNINYSIPSVPGNIIGLGYPGSTASGLTRGAENVAARSLGVYSDGKWHYKRQWSWLPSQVSSEIKSFGISPVSAGIDGYSEIAKWHMCPVQIPYKGPGDSPRSTLTLYDYGVSYSVPSNAYFYDAAMQGTIYKRGIMGNTAGKNIPLNTIIPVPSDAGSSSNAYFESAGSTLFASDVDSGDFLCVALYKTKSGIAKVQITRLDANLTTVKDNTIYSCGTYTKVTGLKPFTGYSGSIPSVGYYKENKFYTLYGELSTNLALIAEINPNNWSSSGNFLDAFTFSDTPTDYAGYRPDLSSDIWLTISLGYPIFSTYFSRVSDLSSTSTSRGTMVLIDPQTNKAYATKYVLLSSANGYDYGIPFMHNISGDNVILQHVGHANSAYVAIDGQFNYYRNLSDYTLYVLPDNAPKREEGQGVTITYEIAWGYSS